MLNRKRETPEEQIARYRTTMLKAKEKAERYMRWAKSERDPRRAALWEMRANEEEKSRREYQRAIECVAMRHGAMG